MPADSGFLRTLDSSIKRNTTIIKKLKQINEEQREGLMDELRNVNMSKFVSEAVAAICDAKLRASDIQAAVQVTSFQFFFYRFVVQFCRCWVLGIGVGFRILVTSNDLNKSFLLIPLIYLFLYPFLGLVNTFSSLYVVILPFSSIIDLKLNLLVV